VSMKRPHGVLVATILGILVPISAETRTPSIPPLEPPAGMTPSLTPRPPYTIRGRLTLITAKLSQIGSICAGEGSYVDIQAGKRLTITDATGRIIGTATLGKGHRATTGEAAQDVGCEFEFQVGGLPQVEVYSIELARRGTLQYSFAEMERQAWFVRLQLRAN
jgi:hypothetical protein